MARLCTRRRRAVPIAAAAIALIAGACGGGGHSHTSATKPATTTAAQGTSNAAGGTPVKASAGQWVYPNADLHNTRNVGGPINASTVSKLGVAWRTPITTLDPFFGAMTNTPIVRGGKIYLQDMKSNVESLDLQSGKVLWSRGYNSPDEGPNGFTVQGNRAYAVTRDNLFALSAQTGEQLWSTKLARNKYEGLEVAPGLHNGLLYVATTPTNPDFHYHGFAQGILWAVNAKTGKKVWSFDTVPKSLWGNKAVNSGGGIWGTPAFDNHGNIYVDIANPGPFPGTAKYPFAKSRPGRDLYTDSLLKLNAKTGKLEWYYQLTPHDLYDRDLQLPPVLSTVGGRQVVIAAGKAGIVFEADAKTGKVRWKRPVGKHNGHDKDNLAAMRGDYSHLKTPVTTFPGSLGGVETPMALDGTTVYAPVLNASTTYQSMTKSTINIAHATGDLVAINVANGHVKWDRKFPQGVVGAATVVNHLVFTSTLDGTLYALDPSDGHTVWHTKLPAGTNAPVSVIGNTLIAMADYPLGKSQKQYVVAYRVGADSSQAQTNTPPKFTTSTPVKSGGGSVSAAAGKQVFAANCTSCHTLAAAGATGTVGPNLDQLKPSAALVRHQVTNGGGGMPAFGSQLSKTQIASVAKYVSSVAGKGGKGKGGGGGGTP